MMTRLLHRDRRTRMYGSRTLIRWVVGAVIGGLLLMTGQSPAGPALVHGQTADAIAVDAVSDDCASIEPAATGMIGSDVQVDICMTNVSPEDTGIGGWGIILEYPDFVSATGVTPCNVHTSDDGSAPMENAGPPPILSPRLAHSCIFGRLPQDGPPPRDGDSVLLTTITFHCDSEGKDGALTFNPTFSLAIDGRTLNFEVTALQGGTVSCTKSGETTGQRTPTPEGDNGAVSDEDGGLNWAVIGPAIALGLAIVALVVVGILRQRRRRET